MNTTIEKPNTTLNGISVTQLVDTMKAIRQEPTLATFRFRAKNDWVTGGLNRTTIGGFYGAGGEDTARTKTFVYHNDEPAVLLGTDESANPAEFVLHALAGCLTTSFVYHAAARGVRVNCVSTEFEGDIDLHGFLGMDHEIRSGYQGIRVKMTVSGDAPEEVLMELIEEAQRRSPVYDTLAQPVRIQVTGEVV